jgi:hypothetical protein
LGLIWDRLPQQTDTTLLAEHPKPASPALICQLVLAQPVFARVLVAQRDGSEVALRSHVGKRPMAVSYALLSKFTQ